MKRLFLTLLLGTGVALAYLWAGLDARPGDGYAMTQPDVCFYLQAARRIVEGAPFSFSEGTAASSGTTTVLYPFVLAVPYALGCTGNAMLLAGWALNALFFLVSLAAWWHVAERRLEDVRARWLFACLLPAFGQLAYVVFAQSDIGFLLAAVSLTAAAFASRRFLPMAVALVLLPWVRPEGMMVALSFAAFAPFAPRAERRREGALAALAVLSACSVFAFNFLLTGDAQFSSVAQKGYFRTLPFPDAARQALADAFATAKVYLLGWTADAPPTGRAWYFPPLLFAALMWTGVAVHSWRRDGVRRELALLLAVAGSFASVLTSGWQGTNMDRYLAWTVPFFLWFFCEGAAGFVRRFGFPARATLGVAIVFLVLDSVVLFAIFRAGVAGCDRRRAFAEACELKMEPGASVGVPCECQVAYAFSPRRVAHLMGVYSPEMKCPIGCSPFELLKHEPSKRFDYWYDDSSLSGVFPPGLVAALGERVIADEDGRRSLIRADWRAFDSALPPAERDGRRLVARVDVGYGPDEEKARFEVFGCRRAHVYPFTRLERLPDGTSALESGVLAENGVGMTVPLSPGRAATMVVRVLPDEHETQLVGFGISVGRHVDLTAANKEIAPSGYTELLRTIPASDITPGGTRIVIPGPVAVCSVWFYQ